MNETFEERLKRFDQTIKDGTGKFRVCYEVYNPDTKETTKHQGNWVYIDEEEAKRDAARFVRDNLVHRAWVEGRS